MDSFIITLRDFIHLSAPFQHFLVNHTRPVDCVARYDPVGDVTETLNFGAGYYARGAGTGVEASAGYVWIAANSGELLKVHEEDLTLEEGYEAARIAALNCLSEICSLVGSVNRIVRIVQVRGFVSSAEGFFDQPKVINGASELLLSIFGDEGKHTRCALGTSVLPANIPVEVEMVVEVE